jgi:hypothetical protein
MKKYMICYKNRQGLKTQMGCRMFSQLEKFLDVPVSLDDAETFLAEYFSATGIVDYSETEYGLEMDFEATKPCHGRTIWIEEVTT